jgi:hypothetical protein
MKRFAYLIAPIIALALGLAACSDSPTEPAAQPIVGTWKTSKAGLAFWGPSPNPTITFAGDGSLKIDDLNGVDLKGSYSTSGSSASSTIRDITMTITSPASMSFTGIYEISGSQMKLEIIPVPAPDGITPPNAVSGMGSTKANGATTNAWVNEMQKQ